MSLPLAKGQKCFDGHCPVNNDFVQKFPKNAKKIIETNTVVVK